MGRVAGGAVAGWAFALVLAAGGCSCEDERGLVQRPPGEGTTETRAQLGPCQDADGDGFGVGIGCLGPDCDDADSQLGEKGERSCYGGAEGTLGIGACVAGVESCAAGVLSACEGQVLPDEESCNGVDDDCDGQLDEALSRSCYTGPEGTEGVAGCAAGVQSCAAGAWSECSGEVLPIEEACNGLDDDCDGDADEEISQPCYTGPAGTEGVGRCAPGAQGCSLGAWGVCVGETLPADEHCDGVDEDCDGQVDEAISRSCYGGPAGTEGVGTCRPGTAACAAGNWLACVGQALPAPEVCDGLDNDCDGEVDEALVRGCYTGPAGTEGVGTCGQGVQQCSAGSWGVCTGQNLPSAEQCDGRDNDCDGQVDETLSRSCYAGPAGTEGVGPCAAGTQSCSSGAWSACEGQVLPSPESCNGADDDCDGTADDALSRACYDGLSETNGVGRCAPGSQGCEAGAWGRCVGQTLPSGEECDGLDNDCDGAVDESLVRACYGGPAGTEGFGLCVGGSQSCALGEWGDCSGQVLPSPEVCDGLDDDCDGRVDESLSRSCYSGPLGTEGVGACAAGSQSCAAGSWGECVGDRLPSAESCDGVDNDCDRGVDEGLALACYTGPAGTEGVGVCHSGSSGCTGGSQGECRGQVLPGIELCNGLDDDCDGQTDEELTHSCYSGPEGTEGVGSCAAGQAACVAGTWLGCSGQVLPAVETCDGRDEDCDGQVDEGLARVCYSGPAGTEGVGVCAPGVQRCVAGTWGACGGDRVPVPESCDGLDNDCDGQADETLARTCYDGPTGTEGIGICRGGAATCVLGQWQGCAGQVLPGYEQCDGRDDDCDGAVDEGLVQTCYDGPPGTASVGACKGGLQHCAAGVWGGCQGQMLPSAERCNGVDEDCDGAVDEELVQACYGGPPGTGELGVCRAGTQQCAGGAWGSCTGEVRPSTEQCNDADDDCDGSVDEILQRACYSGPAGTAGIGECALGSETCAAGSWGACIGERLPAAEVCDARDNDCDGATDEGVTRACYTGPVGTSGVGTCRAGTATCAGGVFGACSGEVRPVAEVCDARDNDCDGSVDEQLVLACYTGPSGTAGVGICAAGTRTCQAGSWGDCAGQTLPGAEVCDGRDEDCDGAVDDGLVRACYGGPAGTEGVGVCRGGSQTCSAGNWGLCAGEVVPSAELCDGDDDDCDGQVDDQLTRHCYGGPSGTEGVGRCVGGTQTCVSGNWGTCAGEALPRAESCDGTDQDCDGAVDEELTRHCYGGAVGTEGIGTCRGGVQICAAGDWGSCLGEVQPVMVEICESGLDEDCDGSVDENPCAGVGTYVCHSCPNASDANPGTQAQPLLTINHGFEHAIVYGFDRIFVANVSAAVADTYAEDVTMVEGISVEGRWVAGTPWTRTSSVRTILRNPTAEGVKFPAGLTRVTRLDGFEVLSAGGVGGALEAAAITVTDSSPTLRDVKAGGLASGAPALQRSYGIKVTGTAARPASPRIEGLGAAQLAGADGGAGAALSAGIWANRAALDLQYVLVTGGKAGTSGVSRGIALVDSAGSQVRDSRVGGGNAGTCVGVWATGETDRVVLERNALRGCEAGPVVPSRGAGALFTGCSLVAGAVPPTVRANTEVTGGVAAGGPVVGLAATDGCPVEVLDNPNISGGSAAQAIGVLCTATSWDGAGGRESACNLRRNTVFGGLSVAVAQAVGISCEGRCLTAGASCAGSCATVSGNTVSGGAGLNLTHLRVTHASPLVERNRIGTLAPACLKDTTIVGLALRGSSSRVESNFVVGGPCEKVWGIHQINERRADGSWPAPDVHSNTVVGGGSTVSLTASESVGVGIWTESTFTAPRLGSYRNNIIVGGQNLHCAAFAEYDSDADPAALLNNDLFNFPVPGGPKPELYVDEGSNALLRIDEVNLLAGAGANLAVDPVFVNTFFDFHLQATTPLVGLGLAIDAPLLDIDGDPRPSPWGTLPDLGADEVL